MNENNEEELEVSAPVIEKVSLDEIKKEQEDEIVERVMEQILKIQ